MSDFWLYVTLGFEHVLDWNAYDHTLFIVALCASHTFKTWKRMLIHVTFFTLGHSLSLVLATYNLLRLDSEWIEFFIPITIIVTALVTLVFAFRKELTKTDVAFTTITFFFGIIHGFGFAGYFTMINEGNLLVHLLEFALGIELAQVVIATLVVLLGYVFQKVLGLHRNYWVVSLSLIVLALSIPMLYANWIF